MNVQLKTDSLLVCWQNHDSVYKPEVYMWAYRMSVEVTTGFPWAEGNWLPLKDQLDPGPL